MLSKGISAMQHINFRRLSYHIRHQYLTANNAVVIVALLVAASWAWGSVEAMERNYRLQKEVDSKRLQLRLAELETQTLKFEQNYYKSDEYKELAVRERMGLVNPGEKVLILPPNSAQATAADEDGGSTTPRRVEQGNLQQWANFLFGGASNRLQD